jgi:uncharacterized protein YjbI with pentapeptide repeats
MRSIGATVVLLLVGAAPAWGWQRADYERLRLEEPKAKTEEAPPPPECEGCDLSGVHLTGQDLSKASFRGVIFSGARLVGTDLSKSDLREASLAGAKLIGADLTRADLRGADLTGAVLIGADVSRSDLRGADLRGAKLIGTDVVRANLQGAKLDSDGLADATLCQTTLPDGSRSDRDCRPEELAEDEGAGEPAAR